MISTSQTRFVYVICGNNYNKTWLGLVDHLKQATCGIHDRTMCYTVLRDLKILDDTKETVCLYRGRDIYANNAWAKTSSSSTIPILMQNKTRLCIKVIGVPVTSRHCLANHIAAYSRWNLFYWFCFSELQSPWQNRLLSIQLSMNFQIKKEEICWESWLRRKRSATSTTDDLSCSRKPNFSTLYFKYCCIRRKLYHRQKQLWATPLISSFFYIRNTFLRPKNASLRSLN